MATFCLLHGAWHDGSCWDALAERLRAAGHGAVAPDLPYHDPDTGYEERIAPALRALDGHKSSLIIVGHSVASGYAALLAVRRGASLIIHLCPRMGLFPSPPGAPSIFRQGFPFPPRDAAGASVWDPEAALEAMYSRLPQQTARALAHRLRPATDPSGEYPLQGHPDIPSVLVYAADDELFQPTWERFMARELLGSEPIEIPGGHFPMVEDPSALADLLDRLAAGLKTRGTRAGASP
jgi:pimeloyl-ACP methyl ester carboxylesterase